MDAEYMDTYCPYCDCEVTGKFVDVQSTIKINDKDISFLDHQLLCPKCGEPIGDARIEDINLKRIRDAMEKENA